MTKFRVGMLLASACICQLLAGSCRRQASKPSFYFWRTKAVLSAKERQALNDFKIRSLYVRFFDVDVPEERGKAVPLGTIDSLGQIPPSIAVVPVVFITNRTFLRLAHDSDAATLAGQILKKVNGLRHHYSELQIDCDWSVKTKERYFLLLRSLRKRLPSSTLLSATIRLHQAKYPIRSGIPPADRGMLMFYNMGNLQDPDAANSIFDAATANAYTPYLKSYALPLDAALPLFRWCLHYRNGHLQALLTKKQLPETSDTSYFYARGNGRFVVRKPGLLNGVSFGTGDVLKYESLDDETLLEAASLLHASLPDEQRSILLYDLDDTNLTYYEKNTLQRVYSTFR